jgi:hypothetical protein
MKPRMNTDGHGGWEAKRLHAAIRVYPRDNRSTSWFPGKKTGTSRSTSNLLAPEFIPGSKAKNRSEPFQRFLDKPLKRFGKYSPGPIPRNELRG